jgi:sigma-54 dependent transcriptional regulator, acetoin dehydrogenase operon transcriptional activator AcoR
MVEPNLELAVFVAVAKAAEARGAVGRDGESGAGRPPRPVSPRRRLPEEATGASTSCREPMQWGDFVTRHAPLWRVVTGVARAARSDLNIVLIGETGTGKEVLARAIHQESRRRAGPFVPVNCGAISKQLCESTFFGYERGAFTGADAGGRRGLLESANGGTLFLDEVGEMPLDIQAGFLRVLESGTFRPIGSEREATTDCRIVAATNRPLRQLVDEGKFRSDLFFRLVGTSFTIPPLRQRPEDVCPLAREFLDAFSERHGLGEKTISAAAMRALEDHSWPGNARELRNVVESAVVCSGEEIGLSELPPEIASAGPSASRGGAGPDAKDAEARVRCRGVRREERRLILAALARYDNVGEVAEALGISRSTLYRRFEMLGIDHRAAGGAHKDNSKGRGRRRNAGKD